MVNLNSRNALYGWQYPIYTDIYDKPVVDALVNAGVSKEIIRNDSDPSKVQPFDFLAFPRSPDAYPWLPEDRIAINMIVKIERKKSGIGMMHSEVVSIPFNRRKFTD